MYYNINITDIGLGFIKNVKSLNLYNCINITQEGISILSKIKKLRILKQNIIGNF